MGRRRDAELMDAATRRSSMLAGVQSRVAVQLYDEGMAELAKRRDDTFGNALLLRDAVQWTEAIDRMQCELLAEIAKGPETEDKYIAAMMRRKQDAEAARRRALASLLLLPQKPRGRPPKAEGTCGTSPKAEEDDGWDSFDDPAAQAANFGDEADAP